MEPKKRTKSEILVARKKTVGGCCERYCNNQGCDCLVEAIDDSADMIAERIMADGSRDIRKPPSQFKPGDVVQLKSGGTPMTVASVSANNQFVNVTWVDVTGKPWEQDVPAAVLMPDCSKTLASDFDMRHQRHQHPHTGMD